MSANKLAIIGLGNPSLEYEGTRHNVGFLVIDRIVKNYNLGSFTTKWNSLLCTGFKNVIFQKPMSYMNNSGRPVLALASYYKIPPECIIVIHDDIDLRLGTVKVKQGGGSGGHNGIKSIDDAIGPNYFRIRIGVGRPDSALISTSDYVLSRFDTAEFPALINVVENISENIEEILRFEFRNICMK